ncbi:MAG: hypothetical protein HOQ35_13340 [Acidobacteriaceae bacterium]|nr:hypothetical protein [Acidobacteriaceae bacterium]
MRALAATLLLLALPAVTFAEDDVSRVRKAIEKSTLDQPGTHPFHLSARIVPRRGSDEESAGTIEVWWSSPTVWRREIKTSTLQLTEITNGSTHWQHTEGEVLPEWLRERAISLITPVPYLSETFSHIKQAEKKNILGSTYFQWNEPSTDGVVQKTMGAGVTVQDNSGLLADGSGFGWNFSYADYTNFHGRMVPTKMSEGAVSVHIEDLIASVPPSLFDTSQPGNDENPLQTFLVDELGLRKNLIAVKPPVWPPLADGPLEGVMTTDLLVDRDGVPQIPDLWVSDNPGLDAAATEYVRGLRFKPVLVNGKPVQAYSRFTLPFKTVRPAGVETFASARTYFAVGRCLSSPAAGDGAKPYVLKATFQTAIKQSISTGQYIDSFQDSTHWRREAVIGSSRFVRARNGNIWYQWSEGDDAARLALVLKLVEPIPTLDTFVESDWRISRQADGEKLIRVARGHEAVDGTLDANSSGYWFDNQQNLRQAHLNGADVQYLDRQPYQSISLPRRIHVLVGDKLALAFKVDSIGEQTSPTSDFVLKGHEWKRQFTMEER